MTASIPWRIVHADVAGSLPALERVIAPWVDLLG